MNYNIKEIYISDLKVYIFYINIKSFKLDEILWLPLDKVKKMSSYIFNNDKKRMIGGIMTYLYGIYSIVHNKDIKNFLRDLHYRLNWNYNIYGKPYFSGDIFFNISHSGYFALCAFSRSEVGVDIEIINPKNIEIAYTFFSKEEAMELMKIERNLRAVQFTEIWVRKESFIKAVGAGMNIDLAGFSFESKSDMLWNVIHKINRFSYYIKDINTFAEGYRAAVCCKVN